MRLIPRNYQKYARNYMSFLAPKKLHIFNKKILSEVPIRIPQSQNEKFQVFLTYQRTATISYLNYVLYFKTKMFTDKLKKL